DTSPTSPDLVYSAVDHPDAGFVLGGAWSPWTARGGGPALCTANLDAYGWKASRQSVRGLATPDSWNAAGEARPSYAIDRGRLSSRPLAFLIRFARCSGTEPCRS